MSHMRSSFHQSSSEPRLVVVTNRSFYHRVFRSKNDSDRRQECNRALRQICAAMRPMWMCLLSVLLLAATPSGSSARISSHDSCFTLRLKERNMAQLHNAVARASGLGEGAGEYMTAAGVATMTGRSRSDIRRLQDFAESLGGSIQEVSMLRDMATLCLGPEASQKLLLASPPPPSSKHRLLLRQPSAESESSMLAASLVQALPRKISAMLHFVHPAPTRARRLQATQGKSQGVKQALDAFDLAAFTQVKNFTNTRLTIAPIPGPASIGPNITLDFGNSANLGYVLTDGRQLVLPIFPRTSPLMYLGLYTSSELMNSIQSQRMVIAFMLPCHWVLDANGTATSISFATQEDVDSEACAATFLTNFTATFSAFGGADVNGSVSQSSAAMRRMTCGDAVQRSASAAGALPRDLCASTGAQVANASARALLRSTVRNPVRNDISNATLIFIYNASAAGLPSFTPVYKLSLVAELQGSNSSDPLRLTIMPDWTLGAVISVAGPNTPAYLNQIYSTPRLSSGASMGLLAAVSSFPGSQYDFSPADLETANAAFGTPTPDIESLLDPTSSTFIPNDPTAAYGPAINDAQTEAALDIQVLTQFGDGSGISYGFGASNSSTFHQYSSTLASIITSNLNLRPLPDIISWSWGTSYDYSSFYTDDLLLAIYDQRSMEAVLAKYAAMGITVLASSGDTGYSGAASPTTCSQAYLSSSPPAASSFVTSVGAVMQSYTRFPTSPSDVPDLVTCMSAAGGVITSGGGFGDYGDFADPQLFSWQKQAVAAYVASHANLSSWPRMYDLETAGAAYCPNGVCSYSRGYPDLSLVGNPVPIFSSGRPLGVSGTSVTAPAMAGLVAQINAAIRAIPGLETSKIGFMNPFLYWAAAKYPHAFTDITIGGNNYPAPYQSLKCPRGYLAAPGWDAATGLGVPNITALQRAAIEYVILQKQQAPPAAPLRPLRPLRPLHPDQAPSPPRSPPPPSAHRLN